MYLLALPYWQHVSWCGRKIPVHRCTRSSLCPPRPLALGGVEWGALRWPNLRCINTERVSCVLATDVGCEIVPPIRHDKMIDLPARELLRPPSRATCYDTSSIFRCARSVGVTFCLLFLAPSLKIAQTSSKLRGGGVSARATWHGARRLERDARPN